jgi:hypothetical protein
MKVDTGRFLRQCLEIAAHLDAEMIFRHLFSLMQEEEIMLM